MRVGIVHISDLHVGKDAETNKRAVKVLKRALKELQDYSLDFGAIISTGDQMHSCNQACKIAWRTVLRQIGKAKDYLITVPGNHDVGTLGILRRRGYKPNYGMAEAPGGEIYCLDSMAGENGIERFGAEGSLGKEQMDWLRRCFAKPFDGLRIVALHHHPMLTHGALRMKDGTEMLRIIEAKSNALLFGHNHRAYELMAGEIMSYGFGGCCPSSTECGTVRLLIWEDQICSVDRWFNALD